MFRMTMALIIGALVQIAPVAAQDSSFGALARVDMVQTRLDDTRDGLRLGLGLTQGVPFRVFTLDGPPRLVLDFREVDWRGADAGMIDWAERARAVRMGAFRPGWSRMVVDLAGPYAVESANATTDHETGGVLIEVELTEIDAEAFAARAGAPPLPGWEDVQGGLPAVKRARQAGEERLLVVLDPGHGGIDPGAEREGHNEKNLMLRFARELREVLLRAGGFDVALTRENDEFVSLERRVAIAQQLGADVFISLHADALSEGRAHGATVYTLADSASDEASAALAERHNRAGILAGVDLTKADDIVAGVLIDLARQETGPRADRLARAIRLGIEEQGLPLHSRPLREAGFSVLKSADIPSVLVELGFLSSQKDRDNLLDDAWRARMANGIRDALIAWRMADAAAARLVRQ
ncbi:N-acetylmuramoyl-L-alanine amidase [Roseovarius amoyensis]|uniref:N-acetylmuramoyl-L-alanine amidase n=1 Tax=Roseovarius amoyensis TaxID=2211448 RepID=UPI00308413EE